MPLFGLKKYQNAKCKNAKIFGAVENATQRFLRSQKCKERAMGDCGSRLKSHGRKVVSIGRYCSDQYWPLCVWGNLCNFVCQKKATREIQTKLSTYYKEKKEDKNMQMTATVKIWLFLFITLGIEELELPY